MRNVFALLLAMFALMPLRAPAVDPGAEILGVWHTTDDKSRVQIFQENGKYYGKIISLKDPYVPADDPQGRGGQPKTDYRNPKPELRNRPIVGLQIMSSFVYAGRNVWAGGTIYDPESGKTYKCKLSLISSNQLEVRGYVGISLLGRTVIWTR